MLKQRILIVDDEDAIRRVFTLALKEPGWRVESACNAEEALEKSRARAFDLYLVDKNMPGMNGVELIREIRKTDVVSRCILITGFANAASAIEAANLGIDAYLEKPCDVFELKKRVERLLRGRDGHASARFRSFFAHESDEVPEVATGIDPTRASSRTSVVVASPHNGVREQIITHLPETSHTLHFATSDEEVVGLFDRETIDAVVLHGSESAVDLVTWIRQAAPSCRVLLAVDAMELPELKRLVDLQVDAMLDVASIDFGHRLEELLRRI